jgi:hypothetical protein
MKRFYFNGLLYDEKKKYAGGTAFLLKYRLA